MLYNVRVNAEVFIKVGNTDTSKESNWTLHSIDNNVMHCSTIIKNVEADNKVEAIEIAMNAVPPFDMGHEVLSHTLSISTKKDFLPPEKFFTNFQNIVHFPDTLHFAIPLDISGSMSDSNRYAEFSAGGTNIADALKIAAIVMDSDKQEDTARFIISDLHMEDNDNHAEKGIVAIAVLQDMPQYAEKMYMPSPEEVEPDYYYKCLLVYSNYLTTEEKQEVFSAIEDKIASNTTFGR